MGLAFDIKHTLKESQGSCLPSLITHVGEKALAKGLTLWSTDEKILQRRANNILLLRRALTHTPSLDNTLTQHFQTIKENEAIFNSDTSEWKDKTSEQIFFETGGLGEHLNHIPGIVAILVFLKVYLAPILAIATPFLIFILPFFMLKFVYNIELPWSQYQEMALNMFIGERKLTINSITKVLYFILSMSQSIIQPFFTAIAVKKLDTLVIQRAKSIELCHKSLQGIFLIFEHAGIKCPTIPGELSSSAYVNFAQDKDMRWTTTYLGDLIGDAEVVYRLSKDTRFNQPIFIQPSSKESSIFLEINGFHDIMISSTVAKKSNVKFTLKTNHSLLTGPNRGGKSSNLRAILQNVLWAQTYGVTPAESYKGKLFDWIISSLRVEDRPGASSLFEREIEIATSILKQENGIGLVLIDEIFHSTNPPDAEKSARIFLEQLWKRNNIISCVSTHVYSIVETSPAEIQKLCAYAEEDKDTNNIWYSYTIQSGICKVSSVNDVLREKGLLAGDAAKI
jgi:hypothetical protein